VIPRSQVLYVLARLRLPLISLNTLIRYCSCAPEACSRHSAILPQGPAPVSGVFPTGDQLHLLEIKVSCNQAIAISRGSPGASPLRLGMTTGFLACYFSLHFSGPGQPSDPEIYLQSLLAVRGIQTCASWRSTVLIPFSTPPAHPICCLLTPAPGLSSPARSHPAPRSASPPAGQTAGRPHPGRQQPPSILLFSQTHDRQAAAPCRTSVRHSAAGHEPNGGCRTRPLIGGDIWQFPGHRQIRLRGNLLRAQQPIFGSGAPGVGGRAAT